MGSSLNEASDSHRHFSAFINESRSPGQPVIDSPDSRALLPEQQFSLPMSDSRTLLPERLVPSDNDLS